MLEATESTILVPLADTSTSECLLPYTRSHLRDVNEVSSSTGADHKHRTGRLLCVLDDVRAYAAEHKLTDAKLKKILETVHSEYKATQIDPGEAVGTVAAVLLTSNASSPYVYWTTRRSRSTFEKSILTLCKRL